MKGQIPFYLSFVNECSHLSVGKEDMQKLPMKKRFCLHKSWQSTIFVLLFFLFFFLGIHFNFFPLRESIKMYILL